jgi:hypothetical protein
MKTLLIAGAVFTAASFAGPVLAADAMAGLPTKASRGAEAASFSGLYLRIDGSYQSIKLPTFDLGLRRQSATSMDQGPIENYDPRATGYGIAGAVGFYFPDGTLPSVFGSKARIELGGGYVNAKTSQAVSTYVQASSMQWQLLNGRQGAGTGCGAPSTCYTNSTLSTDYTSWNVSLKAAGDYRLAGLVMTPSAQVFGGRSRNNQSFVQHWTNGGVLDTPYNANSFLDWTDWGGKLGLDAQFAVTNAVTVGLAGSAGVSRRAVSLSANDGCPDPFFCYTGSTISADATTTAFLANAEASLTVMPTSLIALRGFVGLNYDNKVPGIAAPSYAGTGAVGAFGTPAGIKYEAETSWYAGGGVTVTFAP